MRRLWLHNVGVFEIIPNSGQGSCLFQAISQALTCSTKCHRKIRHSVVEHMTSRKRIYKLADLPDFWKRQIISDWLGKEVASLLKQQQEERRGNNGQGCNFAFNIRRYSMCWFINYFKTKWRLRRCNIIRKLLEANNLCGPAYLKKFKPIFRNFMSNPQEPGTRFELEAASNKFQFQFSFLQALPRNMLQSPKPFSKFSKSDSQNNNCELYSDETKTKGKNGTERGPTSEMEKPVKIGMYQCHSCGSVGYNSPRDFIASTDHFYFLHSSLTTTSEMTFTHAECQNGHWEFLMPISLCKFPIPLNGNILGFTYDIRDSDKNFIPTECGRKRETIDKVAKAIDSYIQKNPQIVPQNIQCPVNEDDYSGCHNTVGFHHEDKDPNGNDMIKRKGVVNGKDLNNCYNMDKIPRTKSNANMMGIVQPFIEVKDDEFSMRELVKRWKTCVSLVCHRKLCSAKKKKFSLCRSYKKLDS